MGPEAEDPGLWYLRMLDMCAGAALPALVSGASGFVNCREVHGWWAQERWALV